MTGTVQTQSDLGRRRSRFVPWVSALLALGLIGGVLWQVRPVRRAPLPPEVPRAELLERQGQLYLKGQTQPFTGVMIDRYPDGSLRSRSALENGVLHGLSEGWHTNGQRAVQEPFVRGASHGVRVKWYPSGVKLSEAEIVNGQLHGKFLRWTEDGKLAERLEMRLGQPDGLALAYYPSGCLKSRVRLQAGRTLERETWEDGQAPAPVEKGSR